MRSGEANVIAPTKNPLDANSLPNCVKYKHGLSNLTDWFYKNFIHLRTVCLVDMLESGMELGGTCYGPLERDCRKTPGAW